MQCVVVGWHRQAGYFLAPSDDPAANCVGYLLNTPGIVEHHIVPFSMSVSDALAVGAAIAGVWVVVGVIMSVARKVSA